MRRIVALLLVFVSLAAAARAEEWQPARTWAFVVGLYRFEQPSVYNNFTLDHGRADDRLVEALRRRGVPSSQIVHLTDKKATAVGVRKALAGLLARTSPGDTLLFYYGSHGDRDDEGVCYLVPYEGGDDSAGTCLKMADVLAAIDRGFKGDDVMMAIDTCNAGGMVDLLKTTPTCASFTCLASSLANEESSDWDFTDCLIDGLKGSPLVDLDGDGQVTLDEVAGYLEHELIFGQEQIPCFYRGARTPKRYVMAAAKGPRPPAPVGEHVDARDDDMWYKARIVAARGNRVRVHFYGTGDDADEWVLRRDTRPHKPVVYPDGTGVLVRSEDDEERRPGTVVGSRGEVFLVKYRNGTDEWVEGRRLVLARTKTTGTTRDPVIPVTR